MQQIYQHIQSTLQDIYRKAVDADSVLDGLQKQNHGKFQSVFTKDAGFNVDAKRFLPYVEELSADFETLRAQPEESQKQALPEFVNKLELMLRTLANFKAAK